MMHFHRFPVDTVAKMKGFVSVLKQTLEKSTKIKTNLKQNIVKGFAKWKKNFQIVLSVYVSVQHVWTLLRVKFEV